MDPKPLVSDPTPGCVACEAGCVINIFMVKFTTLIAKDNPGCILKAVRPSRKFPENRLVGPSEPSIFYGYTRDPVIKQRFRIYFQGHWTTLNYVIKIDLITPENL